jgi:hypothetical protein
MNREQLQQLITATLAEIEQVKRELEETTDPREELHLTRLKKELQIRQLWNIDQLEALKK